MVAKKDDYSAKSIKSLSAHQHLLKRLGLTFGPIEKVGEKFSRQKNVAIREILDNALDEIRGGHGERVRLSFFEDGAVEVTDSGRGIPVDVGVMADGEKASGIHLALGVIQSGGKFETNDKTYSAGLNGVGASSTIHVSKRADVTVYRNKKKYELSFRDGVPGFFSEPDNPDADFEPLDDLTYVRETKDNRSAAEKKEFPTGTSVKVWIRDEVFSSPYNYSDQEIIDRLKRTAFLVPQLEAEVYSEQSKIVNPENGAEEPLHEVYKFPDGLNDLVNMNQGDKALIEPIVIKTEGSYVESNVPVLRDGKVRNEDVQRTVPIEVALSYGDGYEHSLDSFVNTIHTKQGGVHEAALEKAIVTAFNERFISMRGLIAKTDSPPIIDDYKEGLTGVLSVQISEPTFDSQSKDSISGPPEAQKAIQEVLLQEFKKWINNKANADTLQVIAQKVTTASRNRQRAKEQRDINRKKNRMSSASLPAKLLDCELAGTDDSEIIICEGDSALTSLKTARDGEVNALLPIRGKIINAHKNPLKKILENSEAQDIIKTLGAGVGEDFDIEKMRYGRVLIGVDADPDGNAIACLIYALFWHLFRPVIEEGRLYKIEIPLFAFSTREGRKSRKLYARNDAERDKLAAKLDAEGVGYTISRLKGLGEMLAEDLEITAIDPNERVLTKVVVDNVEAAMQSLELVFGSDTDDRKRWIENYEIDDEELM